MTHIARLKQTSKFADCLYPGLHLTYQTFPDNRLDKRTDPQIFHGPIDQCWSDLKSLNHFGAGVYTTINPTDGKGRSADNVIYLTSLFLDLDGAPLDPVVSCRIRPHLVLESSPGRFQCRWKIAPIQVTPENRQEKILLFKAAQVGLAQLFNGDMKVSDISRVARIPGFYNRKRDTPFLVTIIYLDNGPAIDLYELCKALKIDLSPKAFKSHSLSLDLNVHVNLDSDDPIYEGERNVSIFSICRSLAYQDIRGDDLIAHAHRVNEVRCNPPLPEDEVRRTASSVEKYFSDHNYLSPKKLARAIMDSYDENGVDLVYSKGKFWVFNQGRMFYERVDIRKLYSRMKSISDLTRSKELLSETLRELSLLARQGFPTDTLEYQFCRKFLVKNPESKVSMSQVYEAYKKWCRQKGVTPSNQTVLRKELEFRLGVTLKRIRISKLLPNGFIGIDLKTK